jgi:hypothetical protein
MERDDILFDIARAVRSAAWAASATPGWTMLLRLPAGLFDSEVQYRIFIGGCPCRATKLNELVVIDLNLTNDIPAHSGLFYLLARDLEPFIVGVGEVRAEIAPEGRIILRRDDWERDNECHYGITVTGEMIEAGGDVILGELGGAGLGSSFSPSDLAREVFEAMCRYRGTQ